MSQVDEREQDEREQEAADRAALERWLHEGGGGMSTLELRAACHAAGRERMAATEARISRAIADREAKGDTG